jgi:hypothetical protein
MRTAETTLAIIEDRGKRQGEADRDSDDGRPEAQDLDGLRVLPPCDPRRETDEGTHQD